MTKAEIASLIALLKEYYPRDMEHTDIKTRVNAWAYILGDMPYDAGKAAVIAFVAADTKGFPPSVGQIVEQAAKLHAPYDASDELGAWDAVRRAAKSASMSPSSRRLPDRRTSAERNFDALSKDIQSVVHSPEQLAEWAQLPSDTFGTVIQSNFLRAYRARREASREFDKMPTAIKEMAERALLNPAKIKALEEEKNENSR